MTQIPASLLHAVHPYVCDHWDDEALVFRDTRLSYGGLIRYATAFADQLAEHGVRGGDKVAVLMPPRPEAIISLLGCWLVGATWLGINPRYQRREQQQILSDCDAKLLLSISQMGARDYRADLDAHAASSPVRVLRTLDRFGDGDMASPLSTSEAMYRWNERLAAFKPEAYPAVIIYTSGSTGAPKGALISHAGLAFRSHTLHTDRFNIERSRQMIDLPVNHIGALASGIGVALVSGGVMVLSEQFDPGFTLKMIQEERLDVLSGVPAMLARLVDHPDFDQTDLRGLKAVNWGAGPINEAVLDRLLVATTAVFSQQYGMTESNGPISYTPPTRDKEILLNTTGRPDPRLAFRVVDEAGHARDQGEEGEVQVKIPYPFMGYLNQAEASTDAFTADGYLHTGDLAKIRSDGYLVFCGRSKDMYKSGGFNVYPREIEIVLENHPNIVAAAIIGVDDAQWGQVGYAFIELSEDMSFDEIKQWCRDQIADYKVPKHFKRLDTMPRTTVDKIDRVQLAQMAQVQG